MDHKQNNFYARYTKWHSKDQQDVHKTKNLLGLFSEEKDCFSLIEIVSYTAILPWIQLPTEEKYIKVLKVLHTAKLATVCQFLLSASAAPVVLEISNS